MGVMRRAGRQLDREGATAPATPEGGVGFGDKPPGCGIVEIARDARIIAGPTGNQDAPGVRSTPDGGSRVAIARIVHVRARRECIALRIVKLGGSQFQAVVSTARD